jgi:hypothetical protein
LEALGGVIKMGALADQVFRVERQDKIMGQAASYLDGGLRTFNGMGEVINLGAGIIFDLASSKTSGEGANGLGGVFGAVAIALFQISRDGQGRREDQFLTMGEGFIKGCLTIGLPNAGCETGVCCGQRQKT